VASTNTPEPPWSELEQLTQYEAVQLFIKRARQVVPDIHVTRETVRTWRYSARSAHSREAARSRRLRQCAARPTSRQFLGELVDQSVARQDARIDGEPRLRMLETGDHPGIRSGTADQAR
jgi:hypothetical protein